MKKFFLFPALVAVSAFCLLSCNNKDKKDGDSQIITDVVMEEPEHKQDAQTITFSTPEPGAEEKLITIGQYKVRPEKAIFSESGYYVFVGTVMEITKSSLNVGDTYTQTGSYTKDNEGTYNMEGVGSVSTNNQDNQATLTSEGGETIECPAVVEKPENTTTRNENNMARGWVPEGKVKVSIPSRGISTNVEASLKKIADYLKEHDFNIDPADYEGFDIDVIFFTMAGQSFVVTFKNGQAYIGGWNWENEPEGKFSYDFSSQMGSELISGSASGNLSFYQEAGVNKCKFVMAINVKDENANLNFTLKEAQ